MKCKGRPRKSWVAQVESLKEELDIQDEALIVKVMRKALDRREHEEFEVALQQKSKSLVYRQLKWEVGPEEYLELVKEAPSRLFKISFKYLWAV